MRSVRKSPVIVAGTSPPDQTTSPPRFVAEGAFQLVDEGVQVLFEQTGAKLGARAETARRDENHLEWDRVERGGPILAMALSGRIATVQLPGKGGCTSGRWRGLYFSPG